MRRAIARGRVFPQSYSTDRRYGRLSLKTCALFPLIWANADDQGRLSGDPEEIKYCCCPNIDHITKADVSELLKELEQNKLIKIYETLKSPAIQLLDWWEVNQKMQWAYPSDYQSPEGWEDRLRYKQGRDSPVITQNWEPKFTGRAKTEDKYATLERDNYTCQGCGSTDRERLVVHHIIPLRRSGSNDPSNLITLCTKCHSRLEPTGESPPGALAGTPGGNCDESPPGALAGTPGGNKVLVGAGPHPSPPLETEKENERGKRKRIQKTAGKPPGEPPGFPGGQDTYTQVAKKPPDSFSEARRHIFETLNERRGYISPVPGAEAKAITWMLKQGYSVEQILSAYDKLKQDAFWRNKLLNMQSVKAQIGEIVKGTQAERRQGEQESRERRLGEHREGPVQAWRDAGWDTGSAEPDDTS